MQLSRKVAEDPNNRPSMASQGLHEPSHKDAHEAIHNESLPRDSATITDSSDDSISKDAQDGIKKIQGATIVWTRKQLMLAYVFIWIIFFVDSLQQNMSFALRPYVTSSFMKHSLTASTDITASIIGGLIKLPLGKCLDIWGRAESLVVMSLILTVGLVMMAACHGVQTFAAAQVFYWVGYNGLSYTISVFIADTSSLRNRGFMFAYSTSPYLITTWVAGPLAQAFLRGAGWRWAFGTFAIITPLIVLPLAVLLMFNTNKARKLGMLPLNPMTSGYTGWAWVKHYLVEFDVVGLLIAMVGLALFLLPFSLYSYQAKGWKSPIVIAMLVVGVVLCTVFVVYELTLSPKSFMPASILKSSTVLGSCALGALSFASFFIWNSYFSSFLQVVNGLTITEASYVGNIFSLGSCLWALVIGLLIRATGNYKRPALYFGVPMTILGVGLMIHFRQPGMSIGYIIMCQVLIAFAGGTLNICEQTAAMAVSKHDDVATVLALESMFTSIGGAVGQTIAAAVWTGVFPKKLAEYLPDAEKPNLTAIYGSIVTQLTYPIGSPTRMAIIHAYGDAQKQMLIAATIIVGLGMGCVMVWKDVNVKKTKQVKGVVV